MIFFIYLLNVCEIVEVDFRIWGFGAKGGFTMNFQTELFAIVTYSQSHNKTRLKMIQNHNRIQFFHN
jgi:hypothetical protein